MDPSGIAMQMAPANMSYDLITPASTRLGPTIDYTLGADQTPVDGSHCTHKERQASRARIPTATSRREVSNSLDPTWLLFDASNCIGWILSNYFDHFSSSFSQTDGVYGTFRNLLVDTTDIGASGYHSPQCHWGINTKDHSSRRRPPWRRIAE